MAFTDMLDSIFVYLEQNLPKVQQKALKNQSITDLFQYHYSIGMYIRNTCLPYHKDFVALLQKSGMEDTDDMSALLLQLFHLHLNTKK